MKLIAQLLCVFVLLAGIARAADNTPSLAGTWKYVPGEGNQPGSWSDIEMKIAINGDKVDITRTYKAGNRAATEVMNLDVSKKENVVKMGWWPDNRHLGVYVGGDLTKKVNAKWLDNKRILRLDANLILDSQQGSQPVNILSDFKLSASGDKLTLVEIRSSRTQPLVHTFKRVTETK